MRHGFCQSNSRKRTAFSHSPGYPRSLALAWLVWHETKIIRQGRKIRRQNFGAHLLMHIVASQGSSDSAPQSLLTFLSSSNLPIDQNQVFVPRKCSAALGGLPNVNTPCSTPLSIYHFIDQLLERAGNRYWEHDNFRRQPWLRVRRL